MTVNQKLSKITARIRAARTWVNKLQIILVVETLPKRITFMLELEEARLQIVTVLQKGYVSVLLFEISGSSMFYLLMRINYETLVFADKKGKD